MQKRSLQAARTRKSYPHTNRVVAAEARAPQMFDFSAKFRALVLGFLFIS